MRRSVYEQPGTKVDGILPQQGGFQVSRRETKGGKRNEKREKQKARGLHHDYVVRYIQFAANHLSSLLTTMKVRC
jgi:hypothetical protein